MEINSYRYGMKTLAERLSWARAQKGWTQQELAVKAKVSQGTIGNLESGARITARSITSIANALDVDVHWLADNKGTPKHAPAAAPLITAVHPEDAPEDGVVYVPESRIAFSGGSGRVAIELTEDEEPATYRLSWFQKYGINPQKVRRFRVSGDSMVPMLFPRDTILVCTEETNIVDGKLYAIRYGDELRVKYLSRRLDGTLVLRSVNPSYADEVVPPDLAQDQIEVIGRVRDRSGTGGL